MRYIRTKDNVFELDENDIDEKIRIFSLYSYEIYSELKFNALIIAQADSIDEVCDLVRFKTKDGITHYIDLHKNTVADIVVHFGGKNIELDSVRYCIETDKGLIYVAKMNDKGELELI